MEIIITKNYQVMSTVAASLLVKQLKKKKTSVLGLATGKTYVGFYRELSRLHHLKQISFKSNKTFNLDEFVGLDDMDHGSLFYYMSKHFFDHVDLKPKNVLLLDGRAKHLKIECNNFEKEIIKAGGIDLQILGIGHDGHIGFNEPGSSFKSRTRVVNLTLRTRKDQDFKTTREVPKQALTMGIGTIMQAKQIIFMASGENKAEIVAKALRGKVKMKVPASVLQRHPNLVVILDEAAAAKL
jgi:glucosamine-6-phosphate deaminase